MTDELKKALARIAAAYGEGHEPSSPGSGPDLSALVLPVIRRKFPRHQWAPPLRRSIDHQSGPRKVFLFCKECGGGVETQNAHEKDPGACDMEKVRQVMES